jgi:hypothetical protein
LQDQPSPDTQSGGRQLLTWHVVRLNDIGEQFMSALAEVADRHKDVYDQLGLPAGTIGEPLRRHERAPEAAEDSGELDPPTQQTER